MHGRDFHRPARAYPERLPSEAITIARPPALPASERGVAGWLQFALPLVGGLGSLAYMATYLGSGHGVNPVLPLAMGTTVLASIGGGVAMNVRQRRTTKKRTALVRAKYVGYLEQQGKRLAHIAELQRAVDARLYPAPHQVLTRAADRAFLWERRPADDDFLRTRIGIGTAALCCPVHLADDANPLAEVDPDLLARARGVVAQHSSLPDAPITIPLRSHGVVALTGDPHQARALARSLLCQIAASHAPTEVRIAAYFSPEAAPAWSWLKWLPHTRLLRQMKRERDAPGEMLCLLADSVDDFQRVLLSQLLPDLERRRGLLQETRRDQRSTPLPHFVVVLDGDTLHGALGRLPALATLLQAGSELGVTVLCLASGRGEEPPVLQARLEWAGAGWISYEETGFGGRRVEGILPDQADTVHSLALARALAPLRLGSEAGGERDLAQDVRLVQLVGLTSPEEVDPATVWRPRAPEALLRVPIGIGTDGAPLLLDIKEAAEGGMGPHGLIIGATGSGKSELLRTIVTSMAMGHDPEVVSFLLADFKGGASFADLAGLPHTAGMLTNIERDLTLVDRMRASLFGEQERRQRLLRQAGNLDNIQQYWARRRLMPERDPMPHLLIIVDEFAELLTMRPDFLDLFVAIGRVGRSLGMHLLLATQRLGEGRIQGLEGHLRYRICLRTFSAAESAAVIGTPDAFYLPSVPGLGYFKVDTSVYRQFKTATVSSPYLPVLPAGGTAAVRVRHFTASGKLVSTSAAQAEHQAPSAATAAEPDELRTDMDVVIGQLRAGPWESATGQPATAGRSGGSQVHQVCLPPLPDLVTLDTVLGRGGVRSDSNGWAQQSSFGSLRVPLGLLDVPAEQRQDPLVLDFSGAGGHVALVGAPQAGKSLFLQSLVLSLALTHSPREAQIYCIDLGGGALHRLADVPHVGAVRSKLEREQLRRLLRQVRGVIEEREVFFRQHHVESIEAYRAQRRTGAYADQPYGDVFLVVDDLGQLVADSEQAEGELAEIVASGLTYGVHLVLTARRWVEVRAKIRDGIGTRLELRLNDPAESEMGRGAASALAAAPPGRGIIKGGLQFQIAVAQGALGEAAPAGWLQEVVGRMRASWHGPGAPPVLMLPSVATREDLAAADDVPGVPIGLEETRLAPLGIDLTTSGPHFLIFGDGESGKTSLLRHWLRELERRYTPEQARFAVVDNRRNLVDVLDSSHLFAYACTPPMLIECVESLKGAVESRMLSSAQLTLEQLRAPRTFSGPQYYLFVDDYETLILPSGNPFAPLLDAIQQARDIGFHVILARKVSGTSRTAFEPVFQRLKETGSPGLILSGDPQEGALLGTQRAASLPPGRGYLVRRNQRTILVQTPLALPSTS